MTLQTRRINVGTKPSKPLAPLVPNRAPLVHLPLSAPSTHCGIVDAHNGRVGMLPRTLEQAFGPGTRGSYVIPMTDGERADEAHFIVTLVSGVIGVVVFGLICAGAL